MIYFLVILMTFLGSLGAFFFKRSTNQTKKIVSLLMCPDFYVGGIFYGVGALMNVILLRYIDYMILYPMTAITYVWSLVISNRFLGEKVTKGKIAGIFMICLGVTFLTR